MGKWHATTRAWHALTRARHASTWPRHASTWPRHGLDKASHDIGFTRHAKIWLDMPQYGQMACYNKGLTCLDTGSTCLDMGSTCLDMASTWAWQGIPRHWLYKACQDMARHATIWANGMLQQGLDMPWHGLDMPSVKKPPDGWLAPSNHLKKHPMGAWHDLL
jgi:hypothetical protein